MTLKTFFKFIRVVISTYGLIFGVIGLVTAGVLLINPFPHLQVFGVEVPAANPLYQHYLTWMQSFPARLFAGAILATGILTTLFFWNVGKALVDFHSLQSITLKTRRTLLNCGFIWLSVLAINIFCAQVIGYNNQRWQYEETYEASLLTKQVEFGAISEYPLYSHSESKSTKETTPLVDALPRSSSANLNFGTFDCGGLWSLLLVGILLYLRRHFQQKAEVARHESVVLEEAKLTI